VRTGIGIRWWLSLAFAVLAAMTALVVSQVLERRSDASFREQASDAAAQSAFEASFDVARAIDSDQLQQSIDRIADEYELSLWVIGKDGRPETPAISRGVGFDAIPRRQEAIASALGGERFSVPDSKVRTTTVALPFGVGGSGAMLAYADHPDLAAGVAIVHDESVVAALWAMLVGGIFGFLVASFMAARLRRVASAAAAIEAGDLDTPVPPGFGDEVGGLGATIERMRRRLGESFQRLASERDRLERLVERLQEGVLSVHADLSVELANAEARRLLGSPRLRAGHRLPDPWPAFRLESFVAALFAEDAAPVEAQVAIDGDRTIQIAGLPPVEGSDTAIVVLADVSERERRERAEREFVANAAHELRTPLTTIVGAVDALQAGAKDDARHRDRFLAHIERESARLARLTRALLVLARAQTHQEEPLLLPVPARDLLEDVRRGMTPAPGVAVDVECDDDVVLHTERDLVEQALANLAANAVNHTEHGRILLAARTLEGGRVELEVTDTGTGIAAADRERIFERFYRANGRDAGGFGLGLSIVRQAVVALGGTIDAHSAPGSGTRVRIQLPAEVDGAP
jgi:signal transduction histidine kinase